MHAIRAHDGIILPLDGLLPENPTLEVLHAILSEQSGIPLHALVVMHPSGRQVDRTTLHTLLEPPPPPPPSPHRQCRGDNGDLQRDEQEQVVYLFDKELLEVQSVHPEAEAEACRQQQESLVAALAQDPTSQLHATLDLLTNIRNQRAALGAALLNLERHRGDQGAVKAYLSFASPLLRTYEDLLAVYPAAISLVAKVPINSKLDRPPSSSSSSTTSTTTTSTTTPTTKPREKYLADFVSKEKMESVRDGCQRVFDELQRKSTAIKALLESVEEGTRQLKDEAAAHDLEDLHDCEEDAQDAYHHATQLLGKGFPQNSNEEAEFFAVNDDTENRLRYLVERREAESKSLLWSLQRIAELQIKVTEVRDTIRSLNADLKTKCDSFRHLTRLQKLVTSYTASMAELVRRGMFSRLLTSTSSQFAEVFGKLAADEKRRRGLYQAEWMNILPWNMPGLEESVLSVEVDVRGSSSSSNSNSASADAGPKGGDTSTAPSTQKGDGRPGAQVTLADLDDFANALASIDESLAPEDLPPGDLQHPLKDAIALLIRQRGQILSLQQEFDRIANGLEADGEGSEVTSVDLSTGQANGRGVNLEQLRLLEEQRQALERELQSERSQREEEVTALRNEVESLQLVRDELLAQRAQTLAEVESAKGEAKASSTLVEEVRREMRGLERQHDNSKTRVAALEAELSALNAIADSVRERNTLLDREIREARHTISTLQDQVEQLEDETDSLNDKQRDLVAVIGEKERQLVEKDRILRDHRSEAELDRATLEKELTEEKERSAAQCLALQKKVDEVEASKIEVQQALSKKEDELAELQVMCNERGKAIEDARNDSDETTNRMQGVLDAFGAFYSSYTSSLIGVLKEPIHVAATKTAPATNGVTEDYPLPDVDFSSLETASSSRTNLDTGLVALAKEKMLLGLAQAKIWQKECKKYKERINKANAAASEKLAFRSFNVGDLALWLPTRNSAVQVFAAFNLGRPNYFLAPTGVIAEQIKEREWIVARITSITEAVVNHEDPTTNPYSLPNGNKYYRVEAEPYRRASTGHASSSSVAVRPAISHPRRASTSDIPSTSGQVPDGSSRPATGGPNQGETPSSHDEIIDHARPASDVAARAPDEGAPSSGSSDEDTHNKPLDSALAKPNVTQDLQVAGGPSSQSSDVPDGPPAVSGLSSLSAQRPAVLEPVPEQPTPPSPTAFSPPQDTPGLGDVSLASTSVGSGAGAFLPIGGAGSSSTTQHRASPASRQIGGQASAGSGSGGSHHHHITPRSFSSSNDSQHSFSSARRGFGSGSFIGSPSGKAAATISTSYNMASLDDLHHDSTRPPPVKSHTQPLPSSTSTATTSPLSGGAAGLRPGPAATVGRYSGRKSGAASNSGIRQSAQGAEGEGVGHRKYASSGALGNRQPRSSTSGSKNAGTSPPQFPSSGSPGMSASLSARDLLRSFTSGGI